MSETNEKKTKMVSFKLAVPVLMAIEEAVEESPLEFRNRSDFVKRAIERELRLRGKIKTYKEDKRG